MWEEGPRLPKARDDFAHAFDEESGKLYIFGGFIFTGKTNDLICYDVSAAKITTLEAGTPQGEHTLADGSSISTSEPIKKLFWFNKGPKVDIHRPKSVTGARMGFVKEENCLYLFGG